MINQFIITGRLVENPVVKETKEGKKSKITIAVSRPFKNNKGIYETDFIPCILYSNLAINVEKYCKQGDLIGVNGKIQCLDKNLKMVGEKITFLSSNNKEK